MKHILSREHFLRIVLPPVRLVPFPVLEGPLHGTARAGHGVLMGDCFITTTGADARGVAPVKNSTGNTFPRNTGEVPEIITSTGAKSW